MFEVTFTIKPTEEATKQLEELKELKELIMTTREELNLKLAQLAGDVTSEAAEVKAAIDSLKAKIAMLEIPADFTPELEKLSQVSENLRNIFTAPAPAPVEPTPVVEEPVVEEPVAEVPVVQEPVIEEPIVQEPVETEEVV